MKSIVLSIIAAAVVTACGITSPQERTMSLELSPRSVPASSSSAVRHEATPNIDLQIYDNPDLHLAALELGTTS